jgi:hypothetical protein
VKPCLGRAGVLAGCLLVWANSQAASQIGVKAGLSFATLSESAQPREWGTLVGLAAGISFRLPVLPPVLALQPELLYVERGGRDKTNGADNPIKFLDLTLLLRAAVPVSPGSIFVVAGPVASIRMSCPGLVLACDRLFRDFDAGLTAGAGVRARSVIIEGRWHAGLVDITVGSGRFDTRTRTVLVLAGFSF